MRKIDRDPIIIWFVSPSSMRGQGKRSGGMIKGGMAARVSIASRIDTTIDEFREGIERHAQPYIKVNYHNVIMDIKVETSRFFFADPKGYTRAEVKKRLEDIQ